MLHYTRSTNVDFATSNVVSIVKVATEWSSFCVILIANCALKGHSAFLLHVSIKPAFLSVWTVALGALERQIPVSTVAFTGTVFVQQLLINLMSVHQMPPKAFFPFVPTIANATRKLGLSATFVLRVESKRALVWVRPFTLAALERTFLGSFIVGAIY